MISDLDFIILSSVILACVLPFYIYKEKIFKRKIKAENEGFPLFLKELKLYMREHHPKINIDYRIVEKTKNEENTLITVSSCWLINHGLLSTGWQIGLIRKISPIRRHHRIGSTGLYRPGKGGYHQLPPRCTHPKGICRRSSGR